MARILLVGALLLASWGGSLGIAVGVVEWRTEHFVTESPTSPYATPTGPFANPALQPGCTPEPSYGWCP